ncbi:MAG: hypothetical protein R2715_02890 [Ilumatobacteraceae bacterium]
MSTLSRRGLITHTGPAMIAGAAGLAALAAPSAAGAAPVGVSLITPYRLQDSRIDEPGKYDTTATDSLAIDGLDAHVGVLLNLTVTETEGSGFVRRRHQRSSPLRIEHQLVGRRSRPEATMAVVSTNGASGITVQVRGSGRCHLIIDVVGFVG